MAKGKLSTLGQLVGGIDSEGGEDVSGDRDMGNGDEEQEEEL